MTKMKEKHLTIKMEEESSEDWPPELKPNIEDLMKNQMPSSSFPTSGPDYLDFVEEKPFQNEATKDDYMMDSYHDFTSSRIPGVDQTSIANDVCQCSDIFSGFSHGLVGNLVEQKMHPNICPKIKMEIPGTPPSEQLVYQLQQEPWNEILKDPFQSTHNFSLLTQPNIHSLHYHQQQHITSQPSQLQYSQPSIVSKQPHQPTFRQLTNFAELQQSQELRQQYDLSGQQRQSMFHQNISKSLQQPESQCTDASELQLMQKTVRPQLNILNLEMHQHSGHILQRGGVESFEQKTQKIMQPMQFHEIQDSQKKCSVSEETVQQRLQTLAALHQHHGVGDQQQFFQSQRPFTGTSSGECVNHVDWHDEAYKKLQEMRQQYGSQLEKLQKQFMYMYEKSFLQAARPEQVAYYKNNLIENDKMIKFLSIQRNQLARLDKEKFYQYQQVMLKHLSFWKRKSVSVEQQAQTFQPLGLQSQVSQPHYVKLEFHPVNLAPGNKSSVYSMQPGVTRSQPNMVSSLQHGSRMGLEQRNMSVPLQHFARSTGKSVLFAQQTNFSSNAVANAPDSPLNHQTMLPPTFKQLMRSKIIQEKKQQMLMQNCQMGEPPVNQNQTPLPATPCQPLVTSPQKSEHSLPLIDQKTLPSLLKSGIPLHSSCSSLIIASPSTPLTPSSVPLDPEGHNSCVSPILRSEENRQYKTQFTMNQVDVHTQIQKQPSTSELDTLTRTSPSSLLMEFTSPNSSQQSSDTRQPIDRLLKAVELLSPKVLSASAHEIGAIVNLVDTIAGAAVVGDSRGPIGEDLVSKTRFHIQEKNFDSRHVSILAREMKHQISIMASDALLSSPTTTDGFKMSKHQICDFDSTATSRVKRRRKEHNGDLLDEIHCINQQLFETVIDLDSYEDATPETEDSEGIIVRCSYSALALDENLKPYASLVFPVLPLRLLVPSNYPNSSPIILDGLPVSWSCRSKESEYLLEKTKLRFSASIRNLSEPMSLEEMAKTWDASARAVLVEYAQLSGGECFSSRYGAWENYFTA